MYSTSMSNAVERSGMPAPSSLGAREQGEKLLRYFGLRESPFGVTPNPAFLFSSRMHHAALQSMIDSIELNLGFTVLLGGPGMGKTTLLLQLLTQYRDSARTAFIFQTQCKRYELLRFLAWELELPAIPDKDEVALHQRLKEMLVKEARAGRKVLIFIDEAQNLRQPSLEAIRLLSDFETAKAKLLHIILSGSARLGETLLAPELSQLAQRIATVCRLEPLSPEEVHRYVSFRLGVAGCRAAEHLFSPEALAEIAERSEGIPRVVNSICYRALVLAYAGNERRVSRTLARQAARDLDLAHPSGALDASILEPLSWPQDSSARHADLNFRGEKHAVFSSEPPEPELPEATGGEGRAFPPTTTPPIGVDSAQQQPFRPQCKPVQEDFQREEQPSNPGLATPYAAQRVPKPKQGTLRRMRSTLVLSALLLAAALGAGWYEMNLRSGGEGQDGAAVNPVSSSGASRDQSSQPSDASQIYTPAPAAEPSANPAGRKRIGGAKRQAPIIEFPQSVAPSKIQRQPDTPLQEPVPAESATASTIPHNLTLPAETMPAPQPAPRRENPQVAIAAIDEPAAPSDSENEDESLRQPIKVVKPTYPRLAEARHIEGDVLLDLHIDSSGMVQSVRTISGNSLLSEAAQAAARQWQYPPTPGDQPSISVTRVRFNFRLPSGSNR
ncbi:MAG TPA: TonB family protein [Candidatus Angelobacter sp.]|nr:TonB family protein [Candidatus Angelobacter sp.]